MTQAKQKPGAKATVGRSPDEFDQLYDKNIIIPRKIRDALERLGPSWLREQQFIQNAGVNTTELAAYREQFEDYFVTVGGRNGHRIWFGDKRLASEKRAKVER